MIKSTLRPVRANPSNQEQHDVVKSLLRNPSTYAFIAGLAVTLLSGGNYLFSRIADTERAVAVLQAEKGILVHAVDKIEAELEAAKAPGAHYPANSGARLEENLQTIRERVAALEAVNRHKPR